MRIRIHNEPGEVCPCEAPLVNGWRRPGGTWVLVSIPVDPAEAEVVSRSWARRFAAGEFDAWVIGCPTCLRIYGAGTAAEDEADDPPPRIVDVHADLHARTGLPTPHPGCTFCAALGA